MTDIAKDVKDTTQEVGDKVVDKAEEVTDKAGDAAENMTKKAEKKGFFNQIFRGPDNVKDSQIERQYEKPEQPESEGDEVKEEKKKRFFGLFGKAK